MSLHFDYSRMLSGSVGNKGITQVELDGLISKFNSTRADLHNRHDSGNLPFFDLPFNDEIINQVERCAKASIQKYDNFVLMGIGGSALGPVALHSALNHLHYNLLPKRPGCRFFCPDNVDPDYVGAVLDVIEPSKSLFNVVSKSGGTAETMAQFLIVLDLIKNRIGKDWRDHLVLTTDPENGLLRRFARENDVQTFPIHPGVGGRFTVLTPVGLLPAAMVGINIRELCAGAGQLRDMSFSDKFETNPAAMFAALLYLAQTIKKLPIHVMFAYSNQLYLIADWFRQLWAESLGKKYDLAGKEVYTGPTPIKAVGATDQHSQVQLYVEGPSDKAFIILGTKQFGRRVTMPVSGLNVPEATYLEGAELGDLLNAERRATVYALTNAGRPNMEIVMDNIDARHVGGLLYLLEVATLYAGGFYNVNPLDQPGVEAGKKATYALMGRSGYESQRQEIENFFTTTDKKFELKL